MGKPRHCRVLDPKRVDQLLISILNTPPIETNPVLVVQSGPKDYTVIEGPQAILVSYEHFLNALAPRDAETIKKRLTEAPLATTLR